MAAYVLAFERVIRSLCSAVGACSDGCYLGVLLRSIDTLLIERSPLFLQMLLAWWKRTTTRDTHVLQRHVVSMADAGIIELGSHNLILWHFLRCRDGSEREECRLEEHDG
jgi:hypothetical protein